LSSLSIVLVLCARNFSSLVLLCRPKSSIIEVFRGIKGFKPLKTTSRRRISTTSFFEESGLISSIYLLESRCEPQNVPADCWCILKLFALDFAKAGAYAETASCRRLAVSVGILQGIEVVAVAAA
jgi:hypothetical protein